MNQLPFYIPAVFVATTFLSIFLFYRASRKNISLLMVIAGWMTIQSALASTGFFAVTDSIPPRLMSLIVIPFIGIMAVFSSAKGRSLMERFDLRLLTILHTIRLGIELVLFWLFLHKTVPQLMTIEGRNFDLIAGLTAPVIYYLGFVKRKIGINAMLAWNGACLGILLFTVGNAILSAPTPFQQFAFDQPTIAVLYFPFVWLPGIVVPLVIFSHLISLHLLMKQVKQKSLAASTSLVEQVA